MRTTNYMKNTVSEVQGDDIGRLGSNQQEKLDPVGAGVAQPAQDESCKVNMYIELKSVQQEVPVELTAGTKNKHDAGLTLEVGTENDIDVNTDQATQKRNEDDNTDEATSDSPTPTDDTPD